MFYCIFCQTSDKSFSQRDYGVRALSLYYARVGLYIRISDAETGADIHVRQDISHGEA